MMRLLCPVVAFLCLAAALPAVAVEVRGLFEAEVVQPERGEAAKAAAVRAALERVLTKVTGSADVLADPAMRKLVTQADRYLQQYRYREVAPDGADRAGPERRLWVRFDRQALVDTLTAREQPIWGDARPVTVVWLVVEEAGERRMVGAHDNSPLVESLREQARVRGVPVVLPLLDLQDRAAVEPAELWGGFRDVVAAASERYNGQATVIGRVSRLEPGVWRAQWTLFTGSKRLRWSTPMGGLQAIAEAGINGTAEAFAARFAQTHGAGTELRLEVAGVGDLAAYRRTLDYLAGVDGVRRVRVERVTPDTLVCRLGLEVQPESVARTIGLGATLEPVAAEGEGEREGRRYRLRP